MKIVEVSLDALEEGNARMRARRPMAERRLMSSIGECGQQSPVVLIPSVVGGRYEVIDGHKRVRALRKLKMDVVKAVVWEMDRARALVTAYQLGQGSGWNALEEGWLVAELVRFGRWSLKDVGFSMDRSEGWASRRLGLVEGLPSVVLEGVQTGKIGAYAAAKYLLPLARAKEEDCEELGRKIGEASLSSRQVGVLYQHYVSGTRAVARRIVEDPERFLKVWEAARKGARDPALSDRENWTLNRLNMLGNVALGLTRDISLVLGDDTGEAARATLWSAWRRTVKRWGLLAEAVGTMEAAEAKRVTATTENPRIKKEEEEDAQPRRADGDIDVAQAGAREPEDSEGHGGGSEHGNACDREWGGACGAVGAGARA
jgi:ParB/RepB/Spo0J family partition protein